MLRMCGSNKGSLFHTKVAPDASDIEWFGWEERGEQHGGECLALLMVVKWVGLIDHWGSTQLQGSQQSFVLVRSVILPALEDILWDGRCSIVSYTQLVFCTLSELEDGIRPVG